MAKIDEKSYGSSKAKLESIFDAGTFVELGAYTKRSDAKDDFESVVCGYGAVAGALAFAFVQDSGRTKGAFGERHAKKIADMYSLAVKNGAPDELEVMVDNQCSLENVTRFANNQGYSVTSSQEGEDFRLILKK